MKSHEHTKLVYKTLDRVLGGSWRPGAQLEKHRQVVPAHGTVPGLRSIGTLQVDRQNGIIVRD